MRFLEPSNLALEVTWLLHFKVYSNYEVTSGHANHYIAILLTGSYEAFDTARVVPAEKYAWLMLQEMYNLEGYVPFSAVVEFLERPLFQCWCMLLSLDRQSLVSNRSVFGLVSDSTLFLSAFSRPQKRSFEAIKHRCTKRKRSLIYEHQIQMRAINTDL